MSVLDFSSCPESLHADVSWQNDFLVECTIPVSEAVMSAQPMPYSDILGLDRKVRNFQIPLSLQLVDSDGTSPGHPLALQQALTACSRYIGAFSIFVAPPHAIYLSLPSSAVASAQELLYVGVDGQ